MLFGQALTLRIGCSHGALVMDTLQRRDDLSLQRFVREVNQMAFPAVDLHSH